MLPALRFCCDCHIFAVCMLPQIIEWPTLKIPNGMEDLFWKEGDRLWLHQVPCVKHTYPTYEQKASLVKMGKAHSRLTQHHSTLFLEKDGNFWTTTQGCWTMELPQRQEYSWDPSVHVLLSYLLIFIGE